jgi:integrase
MQTTQTPNSTSLIPTVGAPATVATGLNQSRRTRRLQGSTRTAYSKDIQLFLRFGGAVPCDVAAVLRYLEIMRTRKIAPSTAYRRLMSIQRGHVDARHASPTDDPTVRHALRLLATGQYPTKTDSKAGALATDKTPKRREPKSAAPLTRALLLKMLDSLGRNPLDRRDRAILLVGFMSGLKRQRLVALNVDDVSFTDEALHLRIRDDDGQVVKTLAVPATGGDLDAAVAVRQYIEYLALEAGPLFRSFDRGSAHTEKRLAAAYVSVIVKCRLQDVGINSAAFSSESLRVGRALECMPTTVGPL